MRLELTVKPQNTKPRRIDLYFSAKNEFVNVIVLFNVFQNYDFKLTSKLIANSHSISIIIWVCQFENPSSTVRVRSSISTLLAIMCLLLSWNSAIEFRKSLHLNDWALEDFRCTYATSTSASDMPSVLENRLVALVESYLTIPDSKF